MTTIMRKQIERVVGKGNCRPKTLQQLRSTRRTELEEIYPNHVVNEWMGHDGKTAEEHYLQVTPEHWQRASEETGILTNGAESAGTPPNQEPSESGGVTGGVLRALSQAFTAHTAQKTPVFRAVEGSKTLGIRVPISRRGVGNAAVSLAKCDNRLAGGNAGGNGIDEAVNELVRLFGLLDDAARANLLAVARDLAAAQPGYRLEWPNRN